MRSGVKFGEDYLAPDSEVAALDRASGWKPRRDASDTLSTKGLILSLQQERPHGGSFLYRSIETEVLGWIVSKVTGQDLATFMSNALWQPMGAEADGNITIDHEGTALADGGLSATLRDYARFGQLFLDGGARGTKQVVPESWVLACRTGDVAAFQANYAERVARLAQCGLQQAMVGARHQGGLHHGARHLWPADPRRAEAAPGGGQALVVAGSGQRCAGRCDLPRDRRDRAGVGGWIDRYRHVLDRHPALSRDPWQTARAAEKWIPAQGRDDS